MMSQPQHLPTVSQRLEMATRLHRDGRIEPAELECFRILELESNHRDALFLLALIAHQKGDQPRAVVRLERTIRAAPQMLAAYCLLSEVHCQQRKPEAAFMAAEQALKLDSNSAAGLSCSAFALMGQGKLHEAVARFRTCLNLHPSFVRAHIGLGHAFRELGKLDDAETEYRSALELDPRQHVIHSDLGALLLAKGNVEKSLFHCHEALRGVPEFAPAHCNLANALRAVGNIPEAIRSYQRAIEFDPRNPNYHVSLGSALVETSQHQGAIPCFQRALELSPGMAQVWSQLGQAFDEVGDLDQAFNCFRKALTLNPDQVSPYINLAAFHRSRVTDDDIQEMQRLIDQVSLEKRQRSALYFARSHYFDTKKDFEQAAFEAERGNSLTKAWFESEGKSYSPQDHRQFVETSMQVFDGPTIRRLGAGGLQTELPIFVIGMPRSGTTLTEQILSANPRIAGAGEPRFATVSFEALPQFMNRAGKPLECVHEATADHVRKSTEKYLEQLRRTDIEATHIVDKMPENAWYLGWIAAMFPRARIIHCRRDVRDVALSCWLTNFKDLTWTNDFRHIAGRIHDYQRLMEHWRKTLSTPMLEIDYEQLVGDLESTSKKMFEWIGVEWTADCLHFHEAKRSVRTASLAQVRQPVYSHSVARWKNYERYLRSLFEMVVHGTEPTGN